MQYTYCPFCKEKLDYNKYIYSCKNNHSIYINPAPCVSVIPFRGTRILLCKRAVEPRKGTIDFIGGFVNIGETIEQAALREVKEETGLEIKLDKFLYEYYEEYRPNITYPLCFTYTATILGNEEPKASDDISELIWVDIKDIGKLDLKNSFPSIKKVLVDIPNII